MKIINILFVSLILVTLQSCTKEFGFNCVEGTGDIEKRVVVLEPLTKLDLAMSGNLYINEGPQFIEIEAHSDIIDRILEESQIGSERWIIELNKCYTGTPINIWVTIPQVVALDISGSGNISTLDTLRNIESLNLEIDGSGDMDIQLTDANKLDLEIKGSGNINVEAANVDILSQSINGSGDIISVLDQVESCRMRIQGSGNIKTTGISKDLSIEIEGQGDIDALNLCVDNCDIKLKGSGTCNVKVSNILNIDIEGSGDICYRGNPTITSNIDGSGKIKDCN